MKLVDITEFQSLTGIPDSALVWLLRDGKVAHSINEDGQVMLDLDCVKVNKLLECLTKTQHQLVTENRSMIAEHVASIISDNIEEIFNSALSISNKH